MTNSKQNLLRRVDALFKGAKTIGPINAAVTRLEEDLCEVYEKYADDVLTETLKALAGTLQADLLLVTEARRVWTWAAATAK